MEKTTAGCLGIATLSAALAFGSAYADSHMGSKGKDADYTKMNPEELAEYLIFEKKGFDLDQKTQEGTTVRERLKQDELQQACSKLMGESPDSDTANKVRELANKSIETPEGGIKLGDPKKGEEIALNAFGFRVGHNVDDHSEKATGGLCINCHVMDPQGNLPGGSLGPSLANYGQRGTGEEMLKYTYNVIYNPHTTFPCTKMPRFGQNKFLSKEDIQHIMAYLMSPESPVNKK